MILFAESTAHPLLDDTILFVAQRHSGQTDKANVPYMAHLMAVMRRCKRENWHIALLHDIVEDGRATYLELRSLHYDEEEVLAVEALTRRVNDGETYEEYVDRVIACGPRAVDVKLADVLDHLDPNTPTPASLVGQALRVQRYTAALPKLLAAQKTGGSE